MSDTPRADAAVDAPLDGPDGLNIVKRLTDLCDALERENAALRAEQHQSQANAQAADNWRQECADHERWLREMVTDWRLLADDHKTSQRVAINTFICEMRDKLVAPRDDNPQMETLRANLEDARGDRDRWRDIAKNLHRVISEAAGYTHDEANWARDQASLAEWVRALGADKARIDWLEENPIHAWGFGGMPNTITMNGETFVNVRSALDESRKATP
jgi:hypothetical protein